MTRGPKSIALVLTSGSAIIIAVILKKASPNFTLSPMLTSKNVNNDDAIAIGISSDSFFLYKASSTVILLPEASFNNNSPYKG